MITFFMRISIFLLALVMISFVGGLHFFSLVIACLFVCAWLTIVPLDDILWWIIAFAIVFGLVNYDMFGLYTISIIGIAFLFEIIYKYITSTANDNFIILFTTSFVLAMFVTMVINLIQYHNTFLNLQVIIKGIIISGIIFYIFQFIIRWVQRLINLYTHGTDMRCHT